MHIYPIPPIDFGWENLKTVKQTAREFGAQYGEVRADGATSGLMDLEDFAHRWEAAKQAAREAGWEGDFRNEPVVFWVPGENEFDCGFVIKQDNNGTTFVVSPVELRHLEQYR